MTNIINIRVNGGQRVVSARELHAFLEVKTDFTDWCKRMFDFGFEEQKDFTSILGKSTGGRPSVDYALTIDTAKEISMLQRSEKGKQARRYFIDCEKALIAAVPALPSRKELAKMVLDLENENERLGIENAKMLPRSEFVDTVFATDGLIAMSQVAKVLKLDFGRNTLFQMLREKGILFKSNNEPKQVYVNKGYFELKEKLIKRTNHPDKVVLQTYVTQTGLGYIAKALGVITIQDTARVPLINA